MLSLGAVSKILGGDYLEPAVVQASSMRVARGGKCMGFTSLLLPPTQITSLEKNANKYKVIFTDGEQTSSAVLASQLSQDVESGEIKVGTIARINSYTVNKFGEGYMIIASELEVLSQDENMAAMVTSAAKTPAPSGGKASVVTLGGSTAARAPLVGLQNTPGPGPLPSPSEE